MNTLEKLDEPEAVLMPRLRTPRAKVSSCAVEGKTPKLGIHVELRECFTHCSKAFIRSELWNPERFVGRDVLPTNGEIHRALSSGDFDAEQYDRERAERYARREGFY